MWVARDKEGYLHFFLEEPFYNGSFWRDYYTQDILSEESIGLDEKDFEQVTLENSPVEFSCKPIFKISSSVDSLSSCGFDKDTRIMYSLPNSDYFERCVEIGEVYKKHKDDIIEVFGYNPYTNKSGWVKGRLVKAKSKELYKISFNRADWTNIIATHDHLFTVNVNGIYMDVNTKSLKAGDKLLADKAQWNLSTEDYQEIIEVEIKSIERIEQEQDVYCLEILDSDSPYFVLSNGIITYSCSLKNKI